MALIECSECGKSISDKAALCPGCGCPIETVLHEELILDYSKYDKSKLLEEAYKLQSKGSNYDITKAIDIFKYIVTNYSDSLESTYAHKELDEYGVYCATIVSSSNTKMEMSIEQSINKPNIASIRKDGENLPFIAVAVIALVMAVMFIPSVYKKYKISDLDNKIHAEQRNIEKSHLDEIEDQRSNPGVYRLKKEMGQLLNQGDGNNKLRKLESERRRLNNWVWF